MGRGRVYFPRVFTVVLVFIIVFYNMYMPLRIDVCPTELILKRQNKSTYCHFST